MKKKENERVEHVRTLSGVFRISRLFHWDFIVCGTKLVNEVGAAPENILSFYGGVEEVR